MGRQPSRPAVLDIKRDVDGNPNGRPSELQSATGNCFQRKAMKANTALIGQAAYNEREFTLTLLKQGLNDDSAEKSTSETGDEREEASKKATERGQVEENDDTVEKESKSHDWKWQQRTFGAVCHKAATGDPSPCCCCGYGCVGASLDDDKAEGVPAAEFNR